MKSNVSFETTSSGAGGTGECGAGAEIPRETIDMVLESCGLGSMSNSIRGVYYKRARTAQTRGIFEARAAGA